MNTSHITKPINNPKGTLIMNEAFMSSSIRHIPIPTLPPPPLIPVNHLITAGNYLYLMIASSSSITELKLIQKLMDPFLKGRISCEQLVNGYCRLTKRTYNPRYLTLFTHAITDIKMNNAFDRVAYFIKQVHDNRQQTR
jgi:hypothetical protein